MPMLLKMYSNAHMPTAIRRDPKKLLDSLWEIMSMTYRVVKVHAKTADLLPFSPACFAVNEPIRIKIEDLMRDNTRHIFLYTSEEYAWIRGIRDNWGHVFITNRLSGDVVCVAPASIQTHGFYADNAMTGQSTYCRIREVGDWRPATRRESTRAQRAIQARYAERALPEEPEEDVPQAVEEAVTEQEPEVESVSAWQLLQEA